MPVFLNHSNIRKELLKLFKSAEEFLFLVSPFIKLNDEMRRALTRKKDDIDFEIIVLFGKNEEDLSKSLSKNDMEFFQEFKNVSILYNSDLHAKYYANECCAIITSLNLHQYSVRNNIEIGVLIERKFLDFTGDKQLDNEAFDYICSILDDSETVYEHHTKQEKYLFGIFKGEVHKKVEIDSTSEIYSNSNKGKNQIKRAEKSSTNGFCIRTGVEVPFNMKKPFSQPAFESWSKWQNKDFKEKFCHFSGEESNGETTLSRPVLRKNYTAAMKLQKELNDKD